MSWRRALGVVGGGLGEQWERERRDTLFLLAATLLTALVHVPFVPIWASATFGLLFVWRLGLLMSGRGLPRDAIRWLAAIGCTAAIFAQYRTLIGREVGVVILLLFLGLKLLELRARRDHFVVLFLCFFLLLTVFFEDQSLPLAAAAGVAVLALTATMVTMQFGRQEAGLGARLRLAMVLLLQALPIAAVLFVLFPRLQTPLWTMPEPGQGARMGLSDTMQPGSIAELRLSEEVAFRASFLDRVPESRELYWRGPVLTDFDGSQWRARPRAEARSGQPRPPDLALGRGTTQRYAITLEPHNQPWLLALEAPLPDSVQLAQLRLDGHLQLTVPGSVSQRIRYELQWQPDFTLGRHEVETARREALRVPGSANPQARALAARWLEEEADPEARVQRVLKLFGQAPFSYTLQPPVWGENGIDDFLFRHGQGFCEHYAGAMSFLLRAMDVPARVVTGYQGGQFNPINQTFIVRQGDAHAWVEAWLPERGWTRFDPVTVIAPERIDPSAQTVWAADKQQTAGAPRRLQQALTLRLDALTDGWNQWVLSYDQGQQRRLLDRLGLGGVFDDWRQLAALLAAAMAVLIGGVALVTLRPRRPRDPIERWYREFCERLADVGLGRLRHETAGQHLERIGRGLSLDQLLAARQIVTSYNSLRYGDLKNRRGGPLGTGVKDRRRSARADLVLGTRRFRELVKSFRP